jgi:hypothetical protein
VNRLFNEAAVREICERHARGETMRALASAYGLSVGTIYNVVRRREKVAVVKEDVAPIERVRAIGPGVNVLTLRGSCLYEGWAMQAVDRSRTPRRSQDPRRPRGGRAAVRGALPRQVRLPLGVAPNGEHPREA